MRRPTVVRGSLVARIERFAPNLRGTTRSTIGPDLIAGLTVAALAVPQGLAYALVAGLPPHMGLLAAAIPAIVAALMGSSPYLVTGPTNPIALVLAVAITVPALASGAPVPVGEVLATGLLAGVLLLGFGLFGLGRASRFLSDSVIVGFATGAGLLIALRLLPSLAVGGEPLGDETVAWHPLAPKVWPLLVEAGRAIGASDARALTLALAVPASVLALRRIDARIPAALLALGSAGVLVHLLGWDQGPDALAGIGAISVRLPTFVWPVAMEPAKIAPAALAIALLATMQSIAAVRSLHLATGSSGPDPDRELFSQGAANVAAALSGAMPTSGSLTRSALARAAGGRSRLAPAASGLAILLLLPLLATAIERIPLAALVGLVVLSGIDLVNPLALRRAATTRGDRLILAVTLAATLWIDLVQALYVGLFLSLILLVRRSGRLQIVEMVRAGAGRFREIPVDARTGSRPAVLLQLEGDLNFAVAPELGERLREIASRHPRVLVLRLKRARYLDATVLEVMRQVFADCRDQQTTVLLCGLSDEIAALLEQTELCTVLGREALLRAGPRLFEGFERALARTRDHLRPLSDEEIFRAEEAGDEIEGPTLA